MHHWCMSEPSQLLVIQQHQIILFAEMCLYYSGSFMAAPVRKADMVYV